MSEFECNNVNIWNLFGEKYSGETDFNRQPRNRQKTDSGHTVLDSGETDNSQQRRDKQPQTANIQQQTAEKRQQPTLTDNSSNGFLV